MQPSIKELYPIYKEARAWLIERREEYRKECAEYAKQGFRPHYCIHGTNLWVDYDCACWRCEINEPCDTVQAYLIALRAVLR